MRTRQQVDVAFDRTNFIQFTAIRAHFIVSDQSAHFFLNDIMESLHNILQKLWRLYVLLLKMGHSLIINRIDCILTSMLLSDFNRFNETSSSEFTNLAIDLSIYGMKLHFHLLFAGQLNKFFVPATTT
ncbi:hypothetical protein D3C77_412930 [compost metagenome]